MDWSWKSHWRKGDWKMAGIKRQKRFPIGYRIQNGRAEVVPEEAELVQRIFRDYLEGSTTYGIAKWMTEFE